MQKSTYYDLNLVEGADIYNPLINDVPNYETIDQAMHDNAVAGVTVATELASGNVHAITRNNPECSVIRFVATSDWKSNDRMTIDGTEVTARMLDGTVLKNNAYLINSNVLGVLTGTVFTVYAVPFVPENASDIRFNDVENVHDAIIKDREDIALLNSNLNNKDTYTLTSALIESTLHVRGNIGIIEFNQQFKVGLGANEWIGMALLPDGIRATPNFVAQIESVSGTQISIQFLPNGAIQMYSRGGIVEGYLVGNIVFPLA